MSAQAFTARHALGQSLRGQALVASDGFSARYDLDRLQGIFSRSSHKLFGHSYVDKVLVLDCAKGGVATAWMLHEMKSRRLLPKAIVLNNVNPIMAQGAALAGMTLLAGFDSDITQCIASGALVEIDVSSQILRIVDAPASVPSDRLGEFKPIHGP